MDIIKVIVRGELPEGCSDCLLLKTNEQYCYQHCAFYFIPEAKDITDDSKRPTWCPLEEYCEICDGVRFVLHATKGTMPCPECNQESESEGK